MSRHGEDGPVSSHGVDRSRYDTAAHRVAQAACRHVIACAVDATRKAVADHIDYVRDIGDVGILPILIARLGGPCTVPPDSPEQPPTGAASRDQRPTTERRDEQ